MRPYEDGIRSVEEPDVSCGRPRRNRPLFRPDELLRLNASRPIR